jgi:chromosome segregation ATPase
MTRDREDSPVDTEARRTVRAAFELSEEGEMNKKRPGMEGEPAAGEKTRGMLKETAQKMKEEAADLIGMRHAELLSLLKETEEIIRAASFAEVQIDMQKGLIARMSQDKEEKQKALEKLNGESEELKKEADALTAKRNQISTENKGLQKKIETMKNESSKLEERNEKMEDDIKSLEKQAVLLKEDIERLEGIRKEFVEKISRYREKREELVR